MIKSPLCRVTMLMVPPTVSKRFLLLFIEGYHLLTDLPQCSFDVKEEVFRLLEKNRLFG